MIQQLTISIDVPEGYEATGEYRFPLDGEPWLTASNHVRTHPKNDVGGGQIKRIILRKKWAFPAWFRQGFWVFQTSHGSWYVDANARLTADSFLAHKLWSFNGEEFVAPNVKAIQCVRRADDSPVYNIG